jgi:hypothetical protein
MNVQQNVRNVTNSNLWQRASSFLVAANLLINIAQSEAIPVGSESNASSIFDGLDITFTLVSKISNHMFPVMKFGRKTP